MLTLKPTKKRQPGVCAVKACRRQDVVSQTFQGGEAVLLCSKHAPTALEAAHDSEGPTRFLSEDQAVEHGVLKPGDVLQFGPSPEFLEALASFGLSVRRNTDMTKDAPHLIVCDENEAQAYLRGNGKSAEVVAAAASTELDVKREVEAETKETREALAELEYLTIATQEDLDFVGSILVDVKAKTKALEEKRKRATAPLQQSLEEIRSWFRPPLEALGQMERELKAKVSSYHAGVAEQKRLLRETAAAAPTVEVAREALADLATIDVSTLHNPTGVTTRRTWTWEVEDVEKVPREYLAVNGAAVRVAVQSGVRSIPGIRIYEETSVAVKA